MEQAFRKGYYLALLGDKYEKAVAEATRGIVWYMLGNYSESIAGYKNATELFDSVAMPEQALETSVAYGVALYRTGARKEAEARFKKTVQRGRALRQDTETGIALMYLGQLAENNSKYTLAFQYYEEAEKYLGSEVMYRVTLRLGQARALCLLDRYEESARRLDAAAHYSSYAVDLLQPLHASLDLAHALTKQGQVLLAHGDQKRASVALKKACEQAMKVQQSAPEAYRRDFIDSLQEIFSARIEFLLRKGKVARENGQFLYNHLGKNPPLLYGHPFLINSIYSKINLS